MEDYKEANLEIEDVKTMYKAMNLGRQLDERMWLLNRAGKIPFVISCQGQEATQVGTAFALEKGDITAPYYRDLALVTYLGMTPLETMLSAFGKRDDISSGGKQMPSHFSKKRNRNYVSRLLSFNTDFTCGGRLIITENGSKSTSCINYAWRRKFQPR